MKNDSILIDFTHVADIWINELDKYTFPELCIRSSAASWSLGQVIMHLIKDANFYLEQITICAATNDNIYEEASPFAKKMFRNNGFPDEVIKGAPGNADIPQPDSKEQLKSLLENVKDEFKRVSILISKSLFRGKTKHPGLGYFNAGEWMQFAGMHFRHHLRQKKRIDEFLRISNQS